MGSYDYEDLLEGLYSSSSSSSTLTTTSGSVWPAILTILALIGGILIYFLFIKAPKDPTNKYLAKFKDWLSFKSMHIAALLKISYYVLSIYVILSSFSYISSSFVGFITYLVFGLFILRLAYEASMVLVKIWKNTSKIAGEEKRK